VLAAMLNVGGRRTNTVFRALYFLPSLVSVVVAGTIFRLIFATSARGMANTILSWLKIPAVDWIMGGSLTAMSLMVAVAVWRWTGVNVVYFMSGLQSIPEELYEAAEIDGASGLQTVFRIKLPLIQPTIVYLVVVLLIWTMQVFEPIYVMTGGGPVDATTTIVYEMYFSAFRSYRLGYASAISYILLGFLLIATVLQLRVGRTRWSY